MATTATEPEQEPITQLQQNGYAVVSDFTGGINNLKIDARVHKLLKHLRLEDFHPTIEAVYTDEAANAFTPRKSPGNSLWGYIFVLWQSDAEVKLFPGSHTRPVTALESKSGYGYQVTDGLPQPEVIMMKEKQLLILDVCSAYKFVVGGSGLLRTLVTKETKKTARKYAKRAKTLDERH